jgi:hypothetical protein
MRRFVKEHGHARLPIEFADDPALGMWVRTQRKAYAAELDCTKPKCVGSRT